MFFHDVVARTAVEPIHALIAEEDVIARIRPDHVVGDASLERHALQGDEVIREHEQIESLEPKDRFDAADGLRAERGRDQDVALARA